MRTLAALALVVLTAGCSPPVTDGPGCLEEEPAELGRSCSGDGECGQWLVCRSDRCAVPPAVGGDGGTNLEVSADGETVAELQVEIARGDLARDRGLGHRPCIAEGWGLILEFPESGDHVIETDTMRFDLDIAMSGDDRVIHTVHRDAPAGGKALYGAESATKWVLEVPAAVIELAVGQRLIF